MQRAGRRRQQQFNVVERVQAGFGIRQVRCIPGQRALDRDVVESTDLTDVDTGADRVSCAIDGPGKRLLDDFLAAVSLGRGIGNVVGDRVQRRLARPQRRKPDIQVNHVRTSLRCERAQRPPFSVRSCRTVLRAAPRPAVRG